MASTICWRCLSQVARPKLSCYRLRLPRASQVRCPAPWSSRLFTTTSAVQAVASKGKSSSPGGSPKKFQRTTRHAKSSKQEESRGRRPQAGERKVMRKRIVLSNTNALEVKDLRIWDAENVADKSLLGQMVGLPGTLIDSLRAAEGFKATQRWHFFRSPATLVTPECAELARQIEDMEHSTIRTTVRKMIVGEQGSGKSVLLLQAMAMAFLKGWIVIHIPEARDLTLAHTAYAPLAGSSPVQYVQNNYTAELLGRILKANTEVLNSLEMKNQHNLPIPLSSDTSLAKLVQLGSRDPDIAWPVFNAMWSELTTTTTSGSQKRPPILFTLDGLAHVSRLSEYLAPSMHHIHSHDLALVKHFMDHLSGACTLPNGGMVLAADSNANRPASRTLDLIIQRGTVATQAAIGSSIGASTVSSIVSHANHGPILYDPLNPFRPLDPHVLSSLKNVPILNVNGLSRLDVRTLLEYYAASGLLANKVTEGLVAERWVLAGRGIIGEVERGLA